MGPVEWWLGVSALEVPDVFASVLALLRYFSLAEAWRLFGDMP